MRIGGTGYIWEIEIDNMGFLRDGERGLGLVCGYYLYYEFYFDLLEMGLNYIYLNMKISRDILYK